ncbi:MAG: nitrile hydratase accessory protein [Burkholderiales bacterium]|nr:nitrile hydratase accessory protein [Burkholderiales bacterium]
MNPTEPRTQQEEQGLVDPRVAETLPRRSGEITFRAPWEKRAFGITAAFCQQGRFPFDDFRWRVVSEIMIWQQASPGKEENFRFWEHWLRALERTVVDRGLLSWEEISRRAGQAPDKRGGGAAAT